MDNQTILNAAKDCLRLIEGGIIQPDKKYPLKLAEMLDEDGNQKISERFRIK